MPKFTKCWYKDCDSDNRGDPNLLFYKFPKDAERCEQWIMSCANPELTNIWTNSPEKVATLRVCQRHFLKEFLGTSSRLVGHAVPAPYGVSLDQLDAEKFMVECASLRSSTSLVRQHKSQTSQPAPAPPLPPPPSHQQPQLQQIQPQPQLIDTVHPQTSYAVLDQPQPSTVDVSTSSQNQSFDQHTVAPDHQLMPMNSGDYQLAPSELQPMYSQPLDDGHLSTYAQPLGPQYDITYTQSAMPSEMTGPSTAGPYHSGIQPEVVPEPQYQQLTATTTSFNTNTNPRVTYDQEGQVVGVHYPVAAPQPVRQENTSQLQAEIISLKSKLRFYQRKCAVTSHRYQKLKAQTKGRSHKTRLLECLRICKADFDPCVFEIFERQIKGPSSKHGNRWSNEVKSFAAQIFLLSRSAYRFIRATIDLPSDSIVKRYIDDQKLSRPARAEQDDENDESIVESKSHQVGCIGLSGPRSHAGVFCNNEGC